MGVDVTVNLNNPKKKEEKKRRNSLNAFKNFSHKQSKIFDPNNKFVFQDISITIPFLFPFKRTNT